MYFAFRNLSIYVEFPIGTYLFGIQIITLYDLYICLSFTHIVFNRPVNYCQI